MLEQRRFLFSFSSLDSKLASRFSRRALQLHSCVTILYDIPRYLGLPKLRFSHLIVARVTISFDPIRFRDCVVADRRLPVLCDGFVKFFASKEESCSCVLLLSIGGSVSTRFNPRLFLRSFRSEKSIERATAETVSRKRASFA